jgi:tRNA threonylcarbamoyladenosine biosynthesis protein TsaB
MKLLAVETATEACSAALIIDGEVVERYQVAPKEHAKLILPMIDSLMAEAGLKPGDLDCLAFGRGPGSFTGVRIATGVIHGIAFGADLPVVPVSTLAAIAQDFFDNSKNELSPANIAFTAMDARMSEIYWGVYQRDALGFAELLGREAVIPAKLIEFPEIKGVGVGSGWGVYKEMLMTRLSGLVSHCETDFLPRARSIARLGAYGFNQGLAVSVEDAMPVYLRDRVAKKESER